LSSRTGWLLSGVFLLAGIFVAVRTLAEPGIHSPLDFRIRISGSFGEYRPASRYHHGVDIKTYEQNGFPVYAPLDGVVSAIHTSEYGYGNGLFVRSGKYEFTFGHLQDFKGIREDLELYRLSLRFLQPDHYAIVRPPAWFWFTRGQAMARTGESGLGAPHLHFEVREDGVYRNPLLFTGTAIDDHSKPSFTHLVVETATARYLIALPEEGGVLPVALPPVPMRLLVGAFDTQAALNRNGVASLEYGQFSRAINRILPEQLQMADQIIHPTLTFVGRTYFYYLYDRANGAYRVPVDGEQITLRDAAGNASALRLRVEKDADIESFKLDSITSSRRAATGNASLTAYVPAGSVSVQPASAPELKPGLVQAGPAFRIVLRDPMLQQPMQITYTGALPGAALYHVHPVTGIINLIGAGRPAGQAMVFDAPVRLEGIVLPLLDRIPPRVERSFLFGHPNTGEVEANPEQAGWFREYYLVDIGSSIAPEFTVVLLNGNPYPFVFQRDRSAVSVSVPESAAKEGAILSIRCRDAAGNESDWFLDSVEQ
jgi:murein DD-endopeptidase MepM/ murein hydrolase activator NlpD